MFGVRLHEPLPKARQDGVVEARIVVLEAQQIPQSDAGPHSIGCFPVRQTLGVLHDEYKR